jgi:ATPase subunit of ABC transporter with duplicated ATPase domains
MEDASAGYGAEPVLRRLSLTISDDDRIGLLAANGNGKSTFAKLVAGRLKAQGGSIRRSLKLEAGFFAQHQIDDLDPKATPRGARGKDPDKVRPARLSECAGGHTGGAIVRANMANSPKSCLPR